MEYYNNRLCISHQDLIDSSILKESNIKQLLIRGQIERLRRGCRNTPALYAVDTMPHRYKVEVYKRYTLEEEKKASDMFLDNIELDAKAVNYFFEYRLDNGRHLPTDTQVLYSNNASILNAFTKILAESDSHRSKLNKKRIARKDFFAKAVDSLGRISDIWCHSLPMSPRVLNRCYKEYMEKGYSSLISKKYSNSNASKVLTSEQESTLLRFLSHENNLNNSQVASYYNAIAEAKSWDLLTEKSVENYRKRNKLIVDGNRLGVSNFRNMKTMQIKRVRPSRGLLYWTLDGWDCELLYQAEQRNKNGNIIKSYHNRLVLEVVLDPYNDYPIGYAIGNVENANLIKEALKNALSHSKELTNRYSRPEQLQSDHFALSKMRDTYEQVARLLTPARVKNAKSKVVEPYFKYLNTEYCQHCKNWSGFGITTDKTKQPNSEHLNIIKKDFPTEDELKSQIIAMIETERAKKREAYLQSLEGKEEGILSLSDEQYLMLFGETNGYRNSLSHSGLRVSIEGKRYDYESFDISFRELSYIKWMIMYDKEDLSKVLALSEDGVHRYILEKKHEQAMALADRKEGDAEALKKVNDFNKSLEGFVSERMRKVYSESEEAVQSLGRRKGILERLAITDSKGQHKMPRAMERSLRIEDAVFSEVLSPKNKEEIFDIENIYEQL